MSYIWKEKLLNFIQSLFLKSKNKIPFFFKWKKDFFKNWFNEKFVLDKTPTQEINS